MYKNGRKSRYFILLSCSYRQKRRGRGQAFVKLNSRTDLPLIYWDGTDTLDAQKNARSNEIALNGVD